MSAHPALLAIVALASACSAIRPSPEAGPAGSVAAAWVELGPGGGAHVRAIGEGAECPPLTLDGTTRPMQVRAAADRGDFPVTVC